MSKNFDETVRLQSQKREEWKREIRGGRLQRIAEGASSAPRLASSSAASFPGRNKCPGTHCSLIEQDERENSSDQICQREIAVKEKMKKRTEREPDRRREEICWCYRHEKELAGWRTFSLWETQSPFCHVQAINTAHRLKT